MTARERHHLLRPLNSIRLVDGGNDLIREATIAASVAVSTGNCLVHPK